jgi:hypothetical protein
MKVTVEIPDQLATRLTKENRMFLLMHSAMLCRGMPVASVPEEMIVGLCALGGKVLVAIDRNEEATTSTAA